MATPQEDSSPADDEWTHVPRRKGKRNAIPVPAAQAIVSPARDLTLAKLEQDLERKLQVWQQSTCRRQTLAILSRARPDAGWPLRTAVCLASGSPSIDNAALRHRSAWQLVVFLDLFDVLQAAAAAAAPPEPVTAVAQEPRFTALDREFFARRGVRVLDAEAGATAGVGASALGPAGEYLSATSFLYEPFMDMGVEQLRALADADPVLYVGSSVASRVKRTQGGRGGSQVSVGAAAEEAELVKRFMLRRRMYYFPPFEPDPNVFEGLAIIWKEDEEEGGDA